VPYGGFDAVQLRAGEVVVVSGATGTFGSAGVAVALALGAACVVATGRNGAVLEALTRRFGARVRTAQMSGDEERDRQRILDTAPGPIDCVLDLLPPAAAPSQVRAAVRTVRPYGRVVLMGGVREDLALPYAWLMRDCITVRGQWMYPRETIARAIALVHAGLLRLDNQEVTTFPLTKVNDAVAHAAAHAGPFQTTLLTPGTVDVLG
jgi:alcohol dehydrogenase